MGSQYLNELARIKAYNKEENLECAKRIRAGDESAKKEMVEHNLPLVAKICAVSNSQYNNYPIDDMLSHGVTGLMRAVEKYNPELGYSFSTYAYKWIRASIHRGYLKQTEIGARNGALFKTYCDFINEYVKENRISPSMQEIEDGTGISQIKIIELENLRTREISFEPDWEYAESTESEYNLLLNDIISIFKAKLTPKQAEVMTLVAKEYPMKDIARIMNITQEAVRQHKDTALKRLRRLGIDLHELLR